MSYKNMKHLLRVIAIVWVAGLLTACVKEPVAPTPTQTTEQNGDEVTAVQSAYSPSAAQKPRSMSCADGKVYVTCGYPPALLRIDTAEGRIDRMLKFNTVYDLEGIAAANGKLFVASSWTTDESGTIVYDNRVFVIDLASFSLEKVLTVGTDPQRVKAVDATHVVVTCGYGGDVPATSYLIDATTYSATDLGLAITAMDVSDGEVYGYSGGYTAAASFFRFNPLTNSRETILAGCGISNPYSINTIDGKIYVTTDGHYSAAGDVVCFDTTGTQQWLTEAGMLPSKVAALGDGTAYVLDEGNWGANEASIDRINLTTGAIVKNVFSTANSRGLGDVAQDLVVYGTKAYITVSFSNTVEILNTRDNTSRQIAL